MGAFRWVTSTRSEGGRRPAVPHHRRPWHPGGIHGDGVHIAPLNPWLHIYFAMTGVNSFGAQVNGDQQITRQEALRLFTRGNSWFLRMEDKHRLDRARQARRPRGAEQATISPCPMPRSSRSDRCSRVVDGKVVHDDGTLKQTSSRK